MLLFFNLLLALIAAGIWSYDRHTQVLGDDDVSSRSSPRNDTILLGFANNPFGPTRRLPHLGWFGQEKNQTKSVFSKHRRKRGVVELFNMVSCATGCNPIIYKGYGCFCGFLGSGRPVDGIDKCCKYHDWCYDAANCPMFLQYFVPYYWKCFNNQPVCAVEHGEWGGTGSCAQRLCECDRVLSECLRSFPCPKSRAICKSSPLRLLQNAFMLF